MEGFLGFLSDLILFSAGIVVLILWVIAIIAIAIEGYDLIKAVFSKSDVVDPLEPDDDDYEVRGY